MIEMMALIVSCMFARSLSDLTLGADSTNP